MATIKKKSGRPVSEKTEERVWKEIDKFLAMYPSLGKAAQAVGVVSTTAWWWKHRKSRPSPVVAEKMEKISGGIVCAETILYTKKDDLTKYESVKDFVFKNIISKKADLTGLSESEYYTDFVPNRMKKLIENNEIKKSQIPFFVAFFNRDESYWKHAKSNLIN